MTLKAKNRYTFIFSMFFLGISVFFLTCFLLKLNLFLDGSDFLKGSAIAKNFAPFNKNPWAVFAALFCLLFFVPAASFYIYFNFLKTPSAEVVYFALFLFGCSAEFARFLILIESAQNALPQFLVAFGQALFFGRVLRVLSLYAAAIAGMQNLRASVEQNVFLILIISLSLAYFVPIDTTRVMPAFQIRPALNFFSNFFCVSTCFLTFATYAIRAWQSENKRYLALGICTVLIQAGLFVLSTGTALLQAVFGAAILYAGTFCYLNSLHRVYM